MNKKGQSIVEYVVLIIVIIAALAVTATYIKRSVQGRWKSAVDDLGDQYDPRTATGLVTYSLDSQSNSIVNVMPDHGGYMTQRVDSSSSDEKTVGNITVN